MVERSNLVKKKREKKSAPSVGNGGSVSTLQMVAAEADVSPSTVSRFLNGTARVREHKALAIKAAIAKLQFLPNPVAQSLARGQTMSVGVITQDIGSPYYGEALVAIERGLLRAKYSPLFVSAHGREADERQRIDHLLGRRVDGIILLNSCLPDRELAQISRSAPLVLTGRCVAGERIYCLDFDNTDGARLATDYLIGQGHRKIAFIAGIADHPDALQRFSGYKAALAAAKIPLVEHLIAPGEYSDAGGYAAMNRLLDSGKEFSAVFAANDQSGYGAMLALYRRGVRVPEQVSVVGFDDLPGSAYTIPPLTTIHRSTEVIGSRAAEAMIDLMEGRVPRSKVPPATLAVRDSTRPHRA